MKSSGVDSLREIAKREHMIDLHESGIDLVKRGITTVPEILRVAKTFEEDG